MSNTVLTPSIIAAEAVRILDNNLVMAKQVYLDYESEFNKSVNGYKVGTTITIRKPTDFTVRDGAVADIQDVVEGSLSFAVDKQKGVDFRFTSADMTQKIEDLSERVIQPAMIQLANQVDADLHALYTKVPNWVGTAGETINSFTDFALGPRRLDAMGVPTNGRSAVLSPADHWGLLGSQTGLYIQDAAKGAYREGSLGKIGGVDTYMTQNVSNHTTGSRTTTDLVKGALTSTTVTWAATKDTGTYAMEIDGLNGATDTVTAGDVFTIANCYDVNPVTKARLPHLKMFTIVSAATGSGSVLAVTISPPPIGDGAQKNCDFAVADLDDDVVTWIGSASTVYPQNLVFHKNAFALAMVPMELPAGAVNPVRKSHKGISVRMIPYYDGTNDVSNWRLDILYGVKAIDPRLATRLSGTA